MQEGSDTMEVKLETLEDRERTWKRNRRACRVTLFIVVVSALIMVLLISNNLYIPSASQRVPYLSEKLANETAMRQHERQAVLSAFCKTHTATRQACTAGGGTSCRVPAENLLVHDKYKAMWCDIPKVASTTMKMKVAHLSSTWWSVPADGSVHYPYKLARFGLRFLSSYTAKQQQERLGNYYKFIFVRHPLLRVYSAYTDKFIHGRYREHEVNRELRSIRQWRETLQQQHLWFKEFLWLISESGMRGDAHWLSYQTLCMPCNVKYDFIGNLETFNNDFLHIMTTVFNVSQKAMDHPQYGQSHATNSTLAKIQKYITNLTHEERKVLYGHCEEDAQMFGYNLDDNIMITKNKDISHDKASKLTDSNGHSRRRIGKLSRKVSNTRNSHTWDE